MKSGRRRRLRQRQSAEREQQLDASDSESEFDSTGAGTTAVSIQSGKALEAGSDTSGAWQCRMCTFLNEDASARVCELCDTARRTAPKKTQKLTHWLSQPVDKPHNEREKTGSGASQEVIELIDSSDSDTGDSADDFALCSTSSGSYSNTSFSQLTKIPDTVMRTGKVAPTGNKGLWSDLYAPKTVEDLCVNKNKVQELSDWITGNAMSFEPARASVHQRKRLLFLCGPPGSGKSTAVRCLARQLGLVVKEWEDNSSAGKLGYGRMLQEQFWAPEVSSVDDFSDFIHRSSTYAALPVAAARGSASSGSSVRPHNNRKRKLAPGGAGSSSPSSKRMGQLILVESWPQSWSKESSVWEEKLQAVFQSVVDPSAICSFPVVCIYSDVNGGKVDVDHLSRKFSREVMHSPLTSVLTINAVTAAQVKKHLTRVAAQENCRASPEDIQRIIAGSNGDIRHALNMLQLSQNPDGGVHKATAKSSSSKKGPRESGSQAAASWKKTALADCSTRDPFLSDFHVIGKLLHGKIKRVKGTDGTNKETAEVDYDQILDASAMPLDRVLSFVHENSVEYFSQVEDLSEALELLSLCETMIAESYKGVGSSDAFKRTRDAAQAILLRTVAITNANPAPTAFRPITRPRTFATKQRMQSRREEMLRTTRGGEQGLQYACTGDVFAFEVEPFLTIMDRSGGPVAHREPPVARLVSIDDLSIQEELEDEIESSDDDKW